VTSVAMARDLGAFGMVVHILHVSPTRETKRRRDLSINKTFQYY